VAHWLTCWTSTQRILVHVSLSRQLVASGRASSRNCSAPVHNKSRILFLGTLKHSCKVTILHWSVGGVLISLSRAVSPRVEIPLLSVTHGQCDTRPTITFPAYAATKLYCLVTEAVCEQHTQGCTAAGSRNLRPTDRKSSALPLRHGATLV